jgi:hypothetical protein
MEKLALAPMVRFHHSTHTGANTVLIGAIYREFVDRALSATIRVENKKWARLTTARRCDENVCQGDFGGNCQGRGSAAARIDPAVEKRRGGVPDWVGEPDLALQAALSH